MVELINSVRPVVSIKMLTSDTREQWVNLFPNFFLEGKKPLQCFSLIEVPTFYYNFISSAVSLPLVQELSML